MNLRTRLLALLIPASFMTGVTAAGAPAILGSFRIPETEAQKQARIEAQEREQFITDSLLNSIQIDSTRQEIYNAVLPSLNIPRILGGLENRQYNSYTLLPSNYSRLAGVVYATDSTFNTVYPAALPEDFTDPIPDWFKIGVRLRNQLHDASVNMMISNPATVEYADWNLPEPPRLPKEDYSFHAFLKRMNLPDIQPEAAIIPEVEIPRKNWLHYFNVGLQLSQAYVSSNWYQGGNSYVAGLFNFAWNATLNPVYHPNILFQSQLQYKLGVNSNPKGSLHKYNTSQDLFQYTLKTGLKAFNHWFYSLNLLFETQFFNAYPADSEQRSSTLLSPGTLNIGVGMTYTLAKKGANLTVTISPLAYNLKTCVANDIDHAQFNIKPYRKTASEIGSSAEANLTWNFNEKISWKSRLFLFTDYSYFLADWENTINFQFSKLLSTQIYLHPRFDSSTEARATKWRHWMLHEILSFGISYTFQTPK